MLSTKEIKRRLTDLDPIVALDAVINGDLSGHDRYVDDTGKVCAVGAVLVAAGVLDPHEHEETEGFDEFPGCTDDSYSVGGAMDNLELTHIAGIPKDFWIDIQGTHDRGDIDTTKLMAQNLRDEMINK